MPESTRNPYNLAALVILVAAILIGAYFYTQRSSEPVTDTNATTTPYAVTTNNSGVITSGGNATVQENPTVKAPGYRKPLTYPTSMSADVQTALGKQFTATVAVIAKNPTDFSAWINLGTLHKTTGDYAGAAADWTYITQIYSDNTVAWDNLGELALDFTKNYPQAETDFKKSIAINPHDINAYQQLFALYTTYGFRSSTSAAANLIAQGVKANPDNQTLLQLQAQIQNR